MLTSNALREQNPRADQQLQHNNEGGARTCTHTHMHTRAHAQKHKARTHTHTHMLADACKHTPKAGRANREPCSRSTTCNTQLLAARFLCARTSCVNLNACKAASTGSMAARVSFIRVAGLPQPPPRMHTLAHVTMFAHLMCVVGCAWGQSNAPMR